MMMMTESVMDMEGRGGGVTETEGAVSASADLVSYLCKMPSRYSSSRLSQHFMKKSLTRGVMTVTKLSRE